MRKAVIFAGLIGLLASPAMAATLSDVSGSVLANKGRGFTPAVAGDMKAGDMIVSNSNGRAKLVYSATCVVEIEPNMSIEVKETPPCAPPPAGTGGSGLGTTAAIGGAVVGVGVGAVLLFKNEGSQASQ